MVQSVTLNLLSIDNLLSSGGVTISNGDTFTISGSNFGVKSGYSDHLSVSPIMQQAVGTQFSRVGRWSGSNFIGASNRPVIAADGINGKCLYWNHLAAEAPNSCLQFYYDAPIPLGTTLYVSRWVKHRCVQPTVLGGQWKSDRWQAVTDSLSDKPNETYKNIYIITSTDNKIQVRDDTNGNPFGSGTLHSSTSARTPINKNKWVRIDTKITLPSSYANRAEYQHEEWISDPNGVLPPEYYWYTDSQPVDLASPYSSDASRWNMHLMQNYLGSGDGGDFTDLDHELRYDKVFESVGDDWRVEFSTTNNFFNSPRSFVQPLITWTDTTIQIIFDSGGLTSGWIHLVKNNTVIRSLPVNVV